MLLTWANITNTRAAVKDSAHQAGTTPGTPRALPPRTLVLGSCAPCVITPHAHNAPHFADPPGDTPDPFPGRIRTRRDNDHLAHGDMTGEGAKAPHQTAAGL